MQNPVRSHTFALLLALPLTACGGGGGSIASPGSTAPPPLVNTTITSLVASQTFANDAATTTAALDTGAGVTTSAAAARSTLTISYDAGSHSYTVSEPGRSQTFGPGDAAATPVAGETMYKKSANGTSDYLTLVTTPFEITTPNRYVGLGFWQRNQLSGTRQDTTFDLFTYGLDTPAAGVPRTGTARYAMDAFAFLNLPGKAPQTLQGTGTFDVDFKSGVFSQTALMSTFDVITGKPLVTGYLPLETNGTLSGSDGTFTGAMSFSGASGLNRPVTGTSNGRFYGPAGEELGATFAGSNADGATINGGYTGQLGSGGATQNLALTNVTVQQRLYANDSYELISTTGMAGSGLSQSQVDLFPDGSISFRPRSSGEATATFGAAVAVAGPANFISYATTVEGHPVTLSVYKLGSSNGELALTYSSFGLWREDDTSPGPLYTYQYGFAFGIETAPSAVALRTGTAQYTGVAYATAVDAGTNQGYALSGTSSLNVDFGGQRFSGDLSLQGTQRDGTATRDFGTFGFAGALASNALAAPLTQNGGNVGDISAHFYGPAAQEVAGAFGARVGQVSIAGAVAAKQR